PCPTAWRGAQRDGRRENRPGHRPRSGATGFHIVRKAAAYRDPCDRICRTSLSPFLPTRRILIAIRASPAQLQAAMFPRSAWLPSNPRLRRWRVSCRVGDDRAARPAVVEQMAILLDRPGKSKQIALQSVASFLDEKRPLSVALHAFRQNGQIQAVGERDDG